MAFLAARNDAMWPFPKKHFEWREPKEFRRTLLAVKASWTRWWHKPLAGLVAACLLMVNWVLGKLNPNKRPLPFEAAFAICLAGGFFVVYFMAWFCGLAPSTVMVFDNRLFRTTGVAHGDWKFSDIEQYSLRDCGDFRVLVLEMRGGRQSLIGIPLGIDLEALEGFFGSRGLVRVASPQGLQSGDK